MSSTPQLTVQASETEQMLGLQRECPEGPALLLVVLRHCDSEDTRYVMIQPAQGKQKREALSTIPNSLFLFLLKHHLPRVPAALKERGAIVRTTQSKHLNVVGTVPVTHKLHLFWRTKVHSVGCFDLPRTSLGSLFNEICVQPSMDLELALLTFLS